MPRHSNITGAPLSTGRVVVSISHVAPAEILLDAAVDIPVPFPEAPQISHTVSAQSLPEWSPYTLPHRVAAICYVAGGNAGSSSAMVYYQFGHNMEPVASGFLNCPASKHFTISAASFPDIAAGDEITCTLWADTVGITYNYTALALYATAICAGSYPAQHVALVYDEPFAIAEDNSALAHVACPMIPIAGGQPDGFAHYMLDTAVPLVSTHSEYGLACVEYGDAYRGCIVTFHDVAKPYCYANYPIGHIEYTGTVLRI